MRGQASVEQLAVLGIALLIVIPATMLFYNYARTQNEQVVKSQIGRIGAEIIKAANTMAVVGPDAYVVVRLSIPGAVTDMWMVADQLVVNYTSFGGEGHEIFFADVPLIGPFSGAGIYNISDNFHDGLMNIKIHAVTVGSVLRVNISEST